VEEALATIENNTEETVEETKEEVTSEISKVVISTNQLETVIAAFKSCKKTGKERADCRNSFTKFISNSFNLDEFKSKNGDFKIYDSIQSIVRRSASWKKIGRAIHQKNLNKALEYANEGGLALIIDTSNTYGQVVMVQAGETKKSGSWNLNLPNVLSLANHNPKKSFQGKSLAYAFKKSDDLQVFVRK